MYFLRHLRRFKGLYTKSELDQCLFVYIFSTMRSGSTLLKSLLQENLEHKYYPEIDYYQGGDKLLASYEIHKYVHADEVVLKKPSSFNTYKYYPSFHDFGTAKFLILFRNPNSIFLSIKKMLSELGRDVEDEYINEYILTTFENLWQFYRENNGSKIVFYEELVNEPIVVLTDIFGFLDRKLKPLKVTYDGSLNHAYGRDDPSIKFNSGVVHNSNYEGHILVSKKIMDLYEFIIRHR